MSAVLTSAEMRERISPESMGEMVAETVAKNTEWLNATLPGVVRRWYSSQAGSINSANQFLEESVRGRYGVVEFDTNGDIDTIKGLASAIPSRLRLAPRQALHPSTWMSNQATSVDFWLDRSGVERRYIAGQADVLLAHREAAIAAKILELVQSQGFPNPFCEIYTDERGIPLQLDPSFSFTCGPIEGSAPLMQPTDIILDSESQVDPVHFSGTKNLRRIYRA